MDNYFNNRNNHNNWNVGSSNYNSNHLGNEGYNRSYASPNGGSNYNNQRYTPNSWRNQNNVTFNGNNFADNLRGRVYNNGFYDGSNNLGWNNNRFSGENTNNSFANNMNKSYNYNNNSYGETSIDNTYGARNTKSYNKFSNTDNYENQENLSNEDIKNQFSDLLKEEEDEGFSFLKKLKIKNSKPRGNPKTEEDNNDNMVGFNSVRRKPKRKKSKPRDYEDDEENKFDEENDYVDDNEDNVDGEGSEDGNNDEENNNKTNSKEESLPPGVKPYKSQLERFGQYHQRERTNFPGDVISDAPEKSTLIAYIFLAFLGFFGAHRFYIQKYISGSIQLVLGITIITITVYNFNDLTDFSSNLFHRNNTTVTSYNQNLNQNKLTKPSEVFSKNYNNKQLAKSRINNLSYKIYSSVPITASSNFLTLVIFLSLLMLICIAWWITDIILLSDYVTQQNSYLAYEYNYDELTGDIKDNDAWQYLINTDENYGIESYSTPTKRRISSLT